MPLSMTKIAFGIESVAHLRERLAAHAETYAGEARLTTRYLPTRHAEMVGGSLFWIHAHTLVARSPLLGFAQREEDARWWIRLEPRLILVEPRHKRAHQGWRYLAPEDAPPDLGEGVEAGDTLSAKLAGELARLGLV